MLARSQRPPPRPDARPPCPHHTAAGASDPDSPRPDPRSPLSPRPGTPVTSPGRALRSPGAPALRSPGPRRFDHPGPGASIGGARVLRLPSVDGGFYTLRLSTLFFFSFFSLINWYQFFFFKYLNWFELIWCNFVSDVKMLDRNEKFVAMETKKERERGNEKNVLEISKRIHSRNDLRRGES